MSRAPKVCGTPGCPAIVHTGSHCPTHKPRRTRSPSSRVTGTRAWRQLRDQVLARDRYRCVHCGAEATQVHHAEPVARGGPKLPPLRLLESVCDSCHIGAHATNPGDPPKALPPEADRKSVV